MKHRPVLLQEVLAYLDPAAAQKLIDCTFGFGGHALAVVEKMPPGAKLLGIERDPAIYRMAREKIQQLGLDERISLAHGSFSELRNIAAENSFSPADGILFDLGVASWHFDESGRGFSFQKNEPLDMRVSGKGVSARDIINEWSEKELADLFFNYGQERYSRRVARRIAETRKAKHFETTKQLVELIADAVPSGYRRRRIHFATKIFQALRMAVNDELENLAQGLDQAWDILGSGGQLAVISFHSLEDRIVKVFFREKAKAGQAEILTKKPIVPGREEILSNPRARSAKLRVARKKT